MAFTPITKDDVDVPTRQLDRNCPVNDEADLVDIIIALYNAVGELQDQVAAGTTTITQPLPDILKT